MEIPQMITHPVINPIRQGLTSVKGREPVLLFGASPWKWGMGE